MREGGSAEAYYAWASAGNRLGQLRVPTLLINSETDPMVPLSAAEPRASVAERWIDRRVLRDGGHVGFPARVDLGMPGQRGLEMQIMTWFEHVA